MTQIQLLEAITQYLLTFNTAVPIIFSVVGAISLLFKGVTGEGQTLTELADLIEAQASANAPALTADVARYRSTLGI